MATVQNQNFTILSAALDFLTNTLTVDVAFTDADDGTSIGTNRYTLPLAGPVLDGRGRTVVGATPANVISAASTFKTNITTAITAGSSAGKVKP